VSVFSELNFCLSYTSVIVVNTFLVIKVTEIILVDFCTFVNL